MKLVIIQASDIHLSSNRYPNNPVLTRVPSIIAVVRSLFLGSDDVAGCLMLVTGDVAYAGLKAEYDLARPFFRQLQKELNSLYPNAAHLSYFIPGNHDCDFLNDDQARQKLIQDPDASSLEDGSIVTAATIVQDNFFEFCREFSSAVKPAAGLDRLFCSHEFRVGEKRILVRTLNSAWTSQKHESQTLTLPVNYLTAKFAVGYAPDVAITTLHHPYNWFEPNNARSLRKLLEESSDVILTGHEHSSSTYTKTGLTGEQNEYVEGGVLQDNADPSSSSFNVVVIDLLSETQTVHNFTWTGELYECVNDVVAQPFVRNKYRLRGEFELNLEFEENLSDPDATYAHPHKERIQLDDVFVYPDVSELDEKHTKHATKIVRGQDLISHVLKKRHVIITAPERAGKTALARSLFKDLRRNGKIPLMLSGREMKPSTIKKLPLFFDANFKHQYSPSLQSRYWQLPKESRAVIVDDYHCLPMVKDVRNSLLRELLQRFDLVILLGGNELAVQELVGHDRESRLLWEFDHCEVMGFGHRLRSEFIKKWYRIGRDGQVEDVALVNKAIQLEKTISNILGHDLLPPYPIYLLLLLQQLESNNPLETTAASYGRLYGAVVTAYLAKSGAGSELETKINYLGELAFHLYSSKKDHLTDDESRSWHAAYCDRHLDPMDFVGFRDELVKSQVLQHCDGNLRFRYKAGFFYFVSLYLADNLAKEPIRDEVQGLCRRLYREDAANIILFLCHQSKDAIILDEVLASANSLFSEYSEVDLLSDTVFSGKLVHKLADPVLEDTDPESNRLRDLETRDRFKTTSDDDDAYAHKIDDEADEDSDPRGDVVRINATFKTIQIAGAILRNFGGRLDGQDKRRLTDACYSLGLRFLKFAYTMFEKCEADLIDAAQKTLREKDPKLDESRAREVANMLMFTLLKFTTLGVVKHVSNSIGLEKLAPVFIEVLKANRTLPRRMLDLSIRLDHFTSIPVDETLALNDELQRSPIALDVLRQLVFNRFYFFTADYNIKQKVCQKLGIKIQPILLDQDQKRNV